MNSGTFDELLREHCKTHRSLVKSKGEKNTLRKSRVFFCSKIWTQVKCFRTEERVGVGVFTSSSASPTPTPTPTPSWIVRSDRFSRRWIVRLHFFFRFVFITEYPTLFDLVLVALITREFVSWIIILACLLVSSRSSMKKTSSLTTSIVKPRRNFFTDSGATPR